MSDKEAGWYPDPAGENRQRYWDGDSWTEYYSPIVAPTPQIHGAATATADYPYLTSSTTGSHHGLMAAPAAPTRGWPTAPAAGGESGETLEFTGGGGRSSASRWALVAASILVIMLVGGIGWWAFGGSSEDPTVGPTTSTPTGPGPTATGEPVELNQTVTGEVEGHGLWTSRLSLSGETLLYIDARASDSSDDIRIALRPEGGGDAVASNDDRGGALASMGGNALNPLLVATVPAGDYDVDVDNRTGSDAAFDIYAAEVTTELPMDVTEEGAVPDAGAWVAYLEVPADGDYVIDVTGLSSDDGDEPDPVLVAFGPDGDQLVSDDRNADSRDPLLEQQLTAGTWVLLITDWHSRSIDVSVTANAAP